MWKSVAAERSREGLAVEQQSPASEFQIKTAAAQSRWGVYSQETTNVPDLTSAQGKLFALPTAELQC